MSEDQINEDIENDEDVQDELFEHYRIVTDPKQTPIRIDKFLLDKLQNASRNRIQNAIKAGAITLDGKTIKPNLKVKPGQTIIVYLPRDPSRERIVEPEDIPLDIRYEG